MKRWILILAILFSQAASASGMINEQEFTDRYIAAVLNKIEGIKAEKAGNLEVKFLYSDGEERVSYLDNAYIRYQNDPDFLEEILEQYSSSLKEIFEPTKITLSKDRILPVIKDKAYIAQIEKMMKERNKEDEFPFYYERINEELFVLYAFDTEHSIRFVSKDEILGLGVKLEEIRNLAKTNLSSNVPLQLHGDPAKMSMLAADGNYEASYILYVSANRSTS